MASNNWHNWILFLREIHLSEIRLLAEASALAGATLLGCQGKFLLTFHIGAEEMLLVAKAGTPRAFRDLTRAAQLLHELGVRKVQLDLEQYAAHQAPLQDLNEEPGSPLADRRQDKPADSDPEAEPLS
jgi:hypothetical protein